MNIVLRLGYFQTFKGNRSVGNWLNMLYRFSFVRGLILQSSLTRAYSAFSRRHPRWADSCFDEHFLQHKAAPVLARYLEQANPPHPVELATLWADQLRPDLAQKYMSKITPVAAEFLDLFKAELHDHPLFPARDYV